MNIKKKLITAAAAGSILASMLPSAAFAVTDVTIDGNGAFSINKVKLVNKKTSNVSQSNSMTVGTTINSKAKTGKNTSSFNVGGTSAITTGTATNTTAVAVVGGGNTNTGDECGCVGNGLNTVNITGNGAFSYNKVKIVEVNESSVSQSNSLTVGTTVNSSASTGGNSSSFNVGGDSTIETGEASNTTEVVVTGGGNTNN